MQHVFTLCALTYDLGWVEGDGGLIMQLWNSNSE